MPRSTCYRMLANPPRPKPPDPIGPDVLGAFEASRGGYGARRPKVALERSGVVAPRRRICRVTRDNGLSSAYSGRAPKGGARPAQPPSAENVLARAFDGHAPRTHVASDLTYVRAGGSWCYVCLLVDLYNREIVGCSCGRRKDARLVKAAFSNVPFPLVFHKVLFSEFTKPSFRFSRLKFFGFHEGLAAGAPLRPPSRIDLFLSRLRELGAQAGRS